MRSVSDFAMWQAEIDQHFDAIGALHLEILDRGGFDPDYHEALVAYRAARFNRLRNFDDERAGR